jgi:hypothetical protein
MCGNDSRPGPRIRDGVAGPEESRPVAWVRPGNVRLGSSTPLWSPSVTWPGVAAGYVASLTASGGQFCTNPNPGLLLAADGDGLNRFRKTVADLVERQEAQRMPTSAIADAYRRRVAAIAAEPTVTRIAAVALGHTSVMRWTQEAGPAHPRRGVLPVPVPAGIRVSRDRRFSSQPGS